MSQKLGLDFLWRLRSHMNKSAGDSSLRPVSVKSVQVGGGHFRPRQDLTPLLRSCEFVYSTSTPASTIITKSSLTSYSGSSTFMAPLFQLLILFQIRPVLEASLTRHWRWILWRISCHVLTWAHLETLLSIYSGADRRSSWECLGTLNQTFAFSGVTEQRLVSQVCINLTGKHSDRKQPSVIYNIIYWKTEKVT